MEIVQIHKHTWTDGPPNALNRLIFFIKLINIYPQNIFTVVLGPRQNSKRAGFPQSPQTHTHTHSQISSLGRNQNSILKRIPEESSAYHRRNKCLAHRVKWNRSPRIFKAQLSFVGESRWTQTSSESYGQKWDVSLFIKGRYLLRANFVRVLRGREGYW